MSNLSEQVGRQVVFIQDLECKLAELRSSDQPAIHHFVATMDSPAVAPAPKVPQAVSYSPPWANAHPKVTVPITLRLPEELHIQLLCLKDILPNTSMQKIIMRAIKKDVAALLAEHFKS